jgi:hypothetical protein
MRTRVYITCDVECAEERVDGSGHVQPPIGYDMRVWGRFSRQSREHGIGFLMSELEDAGLRGTFFVEALGAEFFGDAGLRDVCHGLRTRGHDVQLHLHPVLTRPHWRTDVHDPVQDDIGDYPIAEQVSFLRRGIAILDRCGVPASEIVAFRAGNFGASNATWESLSAVGLRLSSSYNACYLGGSCRLEWPREEQSLFDTGRGVWELPVTNFNEAGGGKRHLQVSAASTGELIDALEQAYGFGLPEVTLVTHPFEYFYVDSVAKRRGRPNRINQARFRRLCGYLRQQTHRFEVETVGALARRLPLDVGPPPVIALRGKRRHRVQRLVEQAVKRIDERLGGLLIRLA